MCYHLIKKVLKVSALPTFILETTQVTHFDLPFRAAPGLALTAFPQLKIGNISTTLPMLYYVGSLLGMQSVCIR